MPLKGYRQSEKHRQNLKRARLEYWADEERSREQREMMREIGRRNSGLNHPNWKGGQFINNGYIYLLRPNHPNCDKRGYVPRSHLVMEEHLGRYLEPEEVVHHEGERDDDRIEMLVLFPSKPGHNTYHRSLRNR